MHAQEVSKVVAIEIARNGGAKGGLENGLAVVTRSNRRSDRSACGSRLWSQADAAMLNTMPLFLIHDTARRQYQ